MTCPKFHSESALDYSIPLLISLGHIFHINCLAIILEIFSELFVFLILKCCVSLEFKRFFSYSTPKSQVCAPGAGSLLDSLSQAGIPEHGSLRPDCALMKHYPPMAQTPKVVNRLIPIGMRWQTSAQTPSPGCSQKLLAASLGFHPPMPSCKLYLLHPHEMVANVHSPPSQAKVIGGGQFPTPCQREQVSTNQRWLTSDQYNS